MMSKFEQVKYAEIGERLNISIKTVEAQKGKAFAIIREDEKNKGDLIGWIAYTLSKSEQQTLGGNVGGNGINNGEWYSTPILDFTGKVISVVSLVQDVTVNKRLEDKLKLSASVFFHAREGIFITDEDAKIIDVNKTFEEITGYSRSEVLGNKPSMFKSGKQSSEFYRNLWKSIINEGYWAGEIWNRRKNHEIYAQLLTVSAVRDDNGTIKNYIAIFSDISETKEQQYRLEQMAHYDVLTNLPNRTLLAERLDSALTQCKTNKNYAAVVMLDLDGFKNINDTYGHVFGDKVLKLISKIFVKIRNGFNPF